MRKHSSNASSCTGRRIVPSRSEPCIESDQRSATRERELQVGRIIGGQGPAARQRGQRRPFGFDVINRKLIEAKRKAA